MSCCTSRDSRPPAQRRTKDDPNLISASATNPVMTQPRLLVLPLVASSTATWVSSGVRAPRPTPPTADRAASRVITGWRQQYPHSRRSQRGPVGEASPAAPGVVPSSRPPVAVPGVAVVDGGTRITVTAPADIDGRPSAGRRSVQVGGTGGGRRRCARPAAPTAGHTVVD